MARPASFERVRRIPLIGRALDWGMGPSAVSPNTLARARASPG